jgi:nitrogen-specific signal transduction histidine kinase
MRRQRHPCVGSPPARSKLNAISQEVPALVRGELMRHHVSLRTELAHDLPPILGDRAQLQQVVINLLMNSIEAMHEVDERSRELFVHRVNAAWNEPERCTCAH